MILINPEKLPERFWTKIEVILLGCWLWTACLGPRGYGRFRWENRTQFPHRVAYSVLVGNKGSHMRKRTHCPQGHVYSTENTYISKKNYRYCKTCRNEYSKRRQRNKRRDA